MTYFTTTNDSPPTGWDFVTTTKSLRKSSKCSSTTGSENSESKDDSPNIPQLPEDISTFFSSVTTNGYPQKKAGVTKAQPWLKVWEGIIEPDEKGELLVACPKKCDFGSNLGGY